MKVRLTLTLFAVAAAVIAVTAATVYSQTTSLIVKSKKIEYKRRGADVPDHKRSFEVTCPVIQSRLPVAVKKSIEREIDYWRVFKMSLRENLRDETWLSSFDYEVKYNKNHILDIWLTAEGSGAYPDSSTKYIVLDTRTGKRLLLNDLFNAAKTRGLRDLIRRSMVLVETSLSSEEKDTLKSQREDEIYNQFHPGPDKLELKNLSGFTVSNKGVTFLYDYGYPHVIQALEPSGEFFFSWSQLRPYIKRSGLLGRFVR